MLRGTLKPSTRRLLKSLIPTAVFVSFVATLTFTLYSRPVPLSKLQRIGWQSWDVLTTEGIDAPLSSTSHSPSTSKPIGNVSHWWDSSLQGSAQSSSVSLPLDIWAPLLPHHTGITELSVRPCMLHPSLANYCSPRSTLEEDATKGKWVRVERDLNWKSGIWYNHIWYRRSRRLDVPLITSILILEADEEDLVPEPRSSWHKATGSLTDGTWPSQKEAFLWYKLQPPVKDADESIEVQDLITEIDILYGEDRPWFGFTKMDKSIYSGAKESVWVTYRKGVTPVPKPRPLHFSPNGTFRILQIADLHYSVSQGKCRDTLLTPCPHGDTATASFLSRALDSQKPDLVIFSGDQLNGQGTSWDSRSVLAKFAGEVSDRNIPWAAVLGNHDEEGSLRRDEVMKAMERLPMSLVSVGPQDKKGEMGAGNYVLKVKSWDQSASHLLTLYFLDSHAYSSQGFASFWKPKEYDWIKPTQTSWFLNESRRIDAIERPFEPDGANDIGKVWSEKRDDHDGETGKKRLAKPNAMMFFHIPLPEAYSAADVPSSSTNNKSKADPLDFGSQLEGSGSPKHGTFFADGVLKAHETSENTSSTSHEVKVIANGHCHITDRCRRVNGIWSCFGGGGSYSGYGKIGFSRRLRVYDVKAYGEEIETYFVLEDGKVIDRLGLVGPNAGKLMY